MGHVHYPSPLRSPRASQSTGLRWAVSHYSKRLPRWQLRVLMRGALGV